MKKLIVSPAPHIHGKDNTPVIMRDVLIALAPSLLVSVYFFGFSAVKLAVLGALMCVGVEYAIQKYVMKVKVTVNDYSAAVTGLLLALNLPPSAPWWIMLIGSVVAIGIAKMTFGGLGQNLFNPAIVGRVFLLVSFPVIMTDWSIPDSWLQGGMVDASSGATALGAMKEGLKQGLTVPEIYSKYDISYGRFLFGKIGSIGEVSALALLLGMAYLLVRRVIRPHIPFAILGTIIVFTGIFWLIDPQHYPDPLFSILTGGILLGSVYMATDYVTSPMSKKGMIIYGVGIGLITVLIRNFGAYPEGISFAILIMNSVVPLLNMYVKPKRFSKPLVVKEAK